MPAFVNARRADIVNPYIWHMLLKPILSHFGLFGYSYLNSYERSRWQPLGDSLD